MIPPSGEWLELEEVPSTQDVAAAYLREGKPVGVVFAHDQVAGRGRLGRTWLSSRGDSLTASFVFDGYADHPRPWLIGMAVACACAGVLHCQLRWPNDLAIEGRKLGGILTELLPDAQGRSVPVVGVGVNLNQKEFPAEVAAFATSLAQHWHEVPTAKLLVERILKRIRDLPEPTRWSDLAPVWSLFDTTPGKRYQLPSGEEAIGIGIGPEGELLCSIEGESATVMAGQAIFG